MVMTGLLGCSGKDDGSDAVVGATDAAGDVRGEIGTGTDSNTGPDMVGDWSGLGESCASGCNMAVCVSKSTQCKTGWCAWDARYLMDSYCTKACVNGGCPAGYECVKNQLAAGGEYCLKEGPKVPADFGQQCDSKFSDMDCYSGYCADHGASAKCDGAVCVKQSLVGQPFCSMQCNQSTVPCPVGYECRPTPAAGSGGSVCFKTIDPKDYIGAPLCSKVTCPPGDNYCIGKYSDNCPSPAQCIGDQVKGESYCTASCAPGGVTCPSGYNCVKAGVHPLGGDLLYCAKD
jgi:hypothetical protein